ncbi:hypothetical protein RM697_13640, partial [Ichthyenterobacterium sp. W332]|nr:hypothetical protein [Ichthyenterobacterium sp. W332]
MSNFTQFTGKSRFWQSVSNLSCCNIEQGLQKMRSVWAMSLLMLFVFGSSFVFGQSTMTQRSVELNLCAEDRPDPTLSQEDLEFIFSGDCAGSELTYTVSEAFQASDDENPDCGWQVIYSYNVTCGDNSFTYKEIFIGRDQSAPELEGDIPSGNMGMNACFADAPAGPSAAEIALLFSDNCGSVVVTKSGAPEGDDCEWSAIYTYDVRDVCNNVYLGDVKVEYSGGDDEAPELDKKAVVPTGESGLNLCFADKSQGPTEAEIAALFLDNCSDITAENVTKIASSKGTDCKWKATYIYKIEDDCGNTADDIIIEYTGGDTEDPELSGVPADTTVDCIDELPELPLVTATDNCASKPKVVYEEDLSGLGLACEGGVVVRTWTAEDNCFNSVSMSQTITVTPAPKAEFEEATPLEITCEQVEGFEAPSLGYSNGVEDGACAINGEAEGLFEPFQGDCGEFVITYSFEDECGYVITADRTVTVIDNKDPELVVPADATVECDAVPAEDADAASAMDNCDDDVTIVYNGEVRTDGDCADNYTLTRTWTATDNCENSTTLSQTITVQDTTDPVLTVPANVTVECDAVPALDEGAASAMDNCDEDVLIEFIDEKREDGNCADNYTLIRIWRATDNCGNEDIQSQMITVQDTTDPVLTVPGDVTVECDAVPVLDTEAASAMDNCDEDVKIDFVDEKRTDGNCPYNYTLTRTWIATDNCGNSTTESQTITVQDTVGPQLTVPADMDDVECSEVPEPGMASAMDNCDEQPVVTYEGFERTDGDCADSYTLTRTWKAVDSCGNETFESQTITVVDTTDPVVTAPADETVECDEVPEVPEVGSVSGASATDNCDMDVKVEFLKEERVDGDCPNNYELIRIWLGTDNCGNTSIA